MRIDVRFPRVLAPIVGDDLRGTIDVEDGRQVRSALEAAWPGIGNHLFDSTGAMRPHVLCFVDGEPHRLEEEPPVRDGSELRIVQAVSGG